MEMILEKKYLFSYKYDINYEFLNNLLVISIFIIIINIL